MVTCGWIEDSYAAGPLSVQGEGRGGSWATLSWTEMGGLNVLTGVFCRPGSLLGLTAVPFPSCAPSEGFLDAKFQPQGICTAILPAWNCLSGFQRLAALLIQTSVLVSGPG